MFKKIGLFVLIFTLFASVVEARVWKPLGTVITYSPRAHTWNEIITLEETVSKNTFTKPVVIHDFRMNDEGCIEEVFALYDAEYVAESRFQSVPTGNMTLVREIILDVQCN